MYTFIGRLIVLGLLCSFSFSIGYHIKSRENTIKTHTIMEVMQKELDSAESDLKELTVLNDMIEAQAINTILYKIKQSCDTANGFILDEEFYICVNNQKSKPNTDKEHTEPKEEYRL